jgi:hypothetical protein
MTLGKDHSHGDIRRVIQTVLHEAIVTIHRD